MNLAGKTVIVTGASRGIGKDMALRFAARGARVVVAAKTERPHDKLPGTIGETVDAIREAGGEAMAVRLDLRDEESIGAMIRMALDAWGAIDVLVNNAGALFWAPVVDTPTKRLDLVLNVNVRGCFILAREVARHMSDRGAGGAIVMISPPIDALPHPGMVGYWISKVGMTMTAIGLAEELRPRGVAVNALWPATLIESQATIAHRFGSPPQWRKAAIMSDAAIGMVEKGPSFTGHQMTDEEFLRQEGVTDFSPYRCVPDSEPDHVDYSDISGFM